MADLNKLINDNNATPTADRIYKKFHTMRNGMENLSAEQFYNLFGGSSFKGNIENIFISIKNEYIRNINNKISLYSVDEDMDNDDLKIYNKLNDIKDTLENLSFNKAEEAFLKIKFNRNKVAHYFFTEISLTYEDLRTMFYRSMLYVHSIEKQLESMTLTT